MFSVCEISWRAAIFTLTGNAAYSISPYSVALAHHDEVGE